MKLKLAVAGLRHNHIFSLLTVAQNNPAVEIVACAEEDAASRAELEKSGKVTITHTSITDMLDNVDCDAVAIGDCYARRGNIAIAALERNKHVISDKPICTKLSELENIEALATAKKLCLGCMFDLRTAPPVAGAKKLLDAGVIGEVIQIQFTAQHRLMRSSRPSWYFSGNMHGGTINDIGSHAADLIPFLTGAQIKTINGARTWKALARPDEDLNDAGQFMLTLDNGCGVIGDVSYSAPDTTGTLPTYWRFNIWGRNGMIEFNYADQFITAYINGTAGKSTFAVPTYRGPDFLTEFISEISGNPGSLTTAGIITASRCILKVQEFADLAAK